jgi:BioD-like phosphotransacetylase family protein
MQLAALETSTRCLVLSGSNQPPIYNVLQKAENRAIPIISTENTTGDIVTIIEEALSKGRFNQEKKLPKLAEIMKQHLNLKVVL